MLPRETSITSLSKARPRLTGNDIPDDIWRLIVEQVALMTNVVPFMGLNRTFFHHALGLKYCEVNWFVLDDAFLKKLERLQEPVIAQHVRVLHIRAWFIEYLLKRDALFRPPSALSKSKKIFLSPFIRAWKKLYGNSRYSHKVRPQWMLQQQHRNFAHITSCTRVISSMIRALEGMHDVVQLIFEWRDLPLNPDTRRFLTTARTSVDKSLRKLTLRAQISNFKELLAIADFDNLDELNFHFDYKVKGTSNVKSRTAGVAHQEDRPDPEVQESLNTIIPFIEHRQSSLQSLIVSSTSSMDLSPFFRALPSNMPCLRRLGLQIFFGDHTLSDPSAFLHILKSRSSSLRHLSLSANLEQPHLDPEVDDRIKPIFLEESNLILRRGQWNRVNELLLSPSRCLSNLESLEIPFVSLSKTIPLLRRSCDTLTRLRLSDHYLSQDEVTEIIGLFDHRPLEVRHLHIEVMNLDFALLQILATRLPDLSSLVIVYHNIESFGPIPVPCFLNWKLHEFEVYRRRYDPLLCDSCLNSDEGLLQYHLLRWIPSLNSFNRIRRTNLSIT